MNVTHINVNSFQLTICAPKILIFNTFYCNPLLQGYGGMSYLTNTLTEKFHPPNVANACHAIDT